MQRPSLLRLRPALAALLGLGALAPVLPAQQTVIDRAQQGTPTPPAAGGAAADPALARATDEDAGVQRIARPRRLPFKIAASLDEQLYATNNVFLSADDAADSDEDATLLASTFVLRVEGLPTAVGRGLLTPSASFVYQRYLHGLSTDDPAIEDLDFDSFSLPLGVSHHFGRGWEASAGFTVASLYSVRGEPAYELLFRTHTASLGLRKVSELAPSTLLVAGAGISYSDTWTSLRGIPAPLGYRDDRNDSLGASLDAALYRFVGAWTFSGQLRLSHTDYRHWQEAAFNSLDRDDLTLSAGLSATRSFGKHASVRAFVGYDRRDSSLDGDSGEPDYTYDAGTLGAGLTLTVRY